jgi:hypothetical protein
MEEFKENLLILLDGQIDTFKTETLISPDKADQILKENGFAQKDFESNGWDWDFWMTYEKDGCEYTLGGSGWYNNGLHFSKNS